MEQIKREILIDALESQKEKYVKLRNVVEIGSVAREQLENKISATADMIREYKHL